MRPFVMFMFMAGIMLVPGTAAAGSRPSASCENVAGTLQGLSTPVIDAGELTGFEVSLTSGTGPLAESISASLVVEKITPGGTIHFSGTHTFETTAFGTFTTSDKGTVAPEGRVHNTLTIIDGASGFVQSHGEVDLATGSLELRYHGRVCI